MGYQITPSFRTNVNPNIASISPLLMTPFEPWYKWLKPNAPAVATINNTLKTKFSQISENQALNGWGN